MQGRLYLHFIRWYNIGFTVFNLCEYLKMKAPNTFSRRLLVKSSVLGILAASVPSIVYSKNAVDFIPADEPGESLPHDRHPAIQLSVAAEVVGVSHFNLDRLKALVDPRPELAKAVWDWGFGDWESALGAASHVGRKDIIDYLIGQGAAPGILTHAVLGHYEAVKAMITAYPGIYKIPGPHGITLLQHAKTGLETEGVDKKEAQKLIDYLNAFGDAEGRKYLPVTEAEQTRFIGDYKYGGGPDDGFTIKLNMRKMLSLGKPGKSGGALWRIGDNEFTYQGAPSVTIKFDVQNEKVLSLTLNEPGLILTAKKL